MYEEISKAKKIELTYNTPEVSTSAVHSLYNQVSSKWGEEGGGESFEGSSTEKGHHYN